MSDAIELLKQDHEKMKKMLEDVDSTTERALKTREEMIDKIRAELAVHERIEEEVFYPALREHENAKEIVLEAYAEHRAVDTLLDELDGIPFDDEEWAARFTVIKENIEHHIEEEEGELFDKARRLLGDDRLEELGARMEELKSATAER